jgi:periplasmic divalent cation tolerance protein
MYCIALTTVPSEKIAREIARNLVEKKLAACVNIVGNIRSIYTWDKKICNDKEFLLVIKTQRPVFSRLAREIKVLHPYKVPEIIALPIVAGTKDYLNWLEKATRL